MADTVADNVFDAGQFLSETAKNAGELLGSGASTSLKIASYTLAGKMLVLNVIRHANVCMVFGNGSSAMQ
jgi:hypothetical protein